MKISYMIFLVVFSLVASSCSETRSVKCESIDWQKVGVKDALIGKGILAYSARAGVCLGSGDKDAYKRGHAEGRTQYCTKKGVFKAGVRGHRYIHPCDNDKNGKLRNYFQQGRNIFITRNRIVDTTEELDELVSKYKYGQHTSEERKELEERIQSKRREIQIDKDYLTKEVEKYRRSKLLDEGE